MRFLVRLLRNERTRALAKMALLAGSAVTLAAMYLDAKHDLLNEMSVIGAGIQSQRLLERKQAMDRNSVYYMFSETAEKQPNAEMIAFEGKSWSWLQVDLASRRVAHYLLSKGMKSGDTISLFMGNKPAFIVVWIACLSLNVVPSFINTSLTGAGLVHCITVSQSSLLLFDADLSSSVMDAIPLIEKSTSSLLLAQWSDSDCLDPVTHLTARCDLVTEASLLRMSTSPIPDTFRNGITWKDPAVFIFTSGTTGLPKAANVPHGRIGGAAFMCSKLNKFNPSTRLLTAMPLYHGTAAILAVCTGFSSGHTVCIGRKFKATKFWDEVRSSRANTIQYVGETLRYLLAVPPNENDKKTGVKAAFGNGCRPEVWKLFRERFDIPVICEFFGATEANTALVNYNTNDFGAGAIGREGLMTRLLKRNTQVILRIDPITEKVARGENGLCIRAAPNEDGELVALIDPKLPGADFLGYKNNKKATEKKVLRNVLVKGDAFFRTGDLIRKDHDGFTYFSDRLGDTFRWKGENVSTTEVALALSAVTEDPNVYGVSLPNIDGRAGCVAIVANRTTSLEKIATQVLKQLPKYAQPLFIRVVDKMETTGTQKQLKVRLRNEGVDPNVVKDPIFWLQNGNVYKAFTTSDWVALQNGRVKL